MTDLITKRNIGGDMAEQQSWPKKPTLVRPLPLRASAKMPFGAGSSFQPWKKPSGDNNNSGRGVNAEATISSNTTKPCHRLATCYNSTTPEENGNNQNIENHSTEKNPTNIGTGATSGATNDDDNTANTDEVQPDQHGTGCSTKPEMDPKKLKRMVANRLSAQRSREKRNAYVADLENKAKAYQEKIALIHPQIAAQKNQVQSLQIEQHRLKLLMAAREKQRILQEVSIEKNRAEADRLRRLHGKLAAESQARMLNMGPAASQLRTDSNLCPSGLGRFVCNNSLQGSRNYQEKIGILYGHAALNGVETSKTQVGTTDHPQNQSQVMVTAKWDNRLGSITNLNIVKSEPES